MPRSSSSRIRRVRKVAKKPFSPKNPTVQRRKPKMMNEVLNGATSFFNGSRQLLTGNPVPAMMVTTHKYVANSITLTVAPSGLCITPYYWVLNDVYRPDFTGSTFGPHQPLGYDQMRGFYDRSTVLQAKVSIRVLNGKDRYSGLVIFVKKQTDVADPSGQTCTQWMEKPQSWVVSPGVVSQEYQNFVATFDIAKQLGLTKAKLLADDSYSSKGNASPDAQATLLLGLSAGNILTGSTATIDCLLSIEYTVAWQNPVVLQSS